MSPEQAILMRLNVIACPDCGRGVQANERPASGFIARCGRRIALVGELGVAQCPHQDDESEPDHPLASPEGSNQ